MDNGLSVCFIAKDENDNGKNIERALKSIKDIADEIIVIDREFSYNTVDIAEKFSANVFFEIFEENLDKLKNKALEKCNKNWILMMECNEAFDTLKIKEVKETIKSTKAEGIYLKIAEVIDDNVINEKSSLRIFKNKSNYRYKENSQEIDFKLDKNKKNETILFTDITLKQYSYKHNSLDWKEKILENIKALEHVRESKKDSFYYFSLGKEYIKLNDLNKALKYFKKSTKINDGYHGCKPYLAMDLCEILCDKGKYDLALKYSKKFLIELKDFREMYFVQAICYFKMGMYKESYTNLDKFLNSKVNIDKYPSFNLEKQNDIEGIMVWLKNNLQL